MIEYRVLLFDPNRIFDPKLRGCLVHGIYWNWNWKNPLKTRDVFGSHVNLWNWNLIYIKKTNSPFKIKKYK